MKRLSKQLPSYVQVDVELRNRFPIGKFTFGSTDPRVPGKALGAIALWDEIQRAFLEFEEGGNDGIWLVSVLGHLGFRGYEIIEFDADSALAEDREETHLQPSLSTRCVRCDDLVRTSDPRRDMCGHCIAEQDGKEKPKAPSYSTNDPKGWCGDPRRGAAMGRPSVHATEYSGKLYLREIRLDSGGYDPNGTYFGAGERLYWCASADGEVDFMLRAAGREEAKAKVLGRYPQGRFFR